MTLPGTSLIMSLACTQTCPLSCLQMKQRLRLARLLPTVGGGPTCLSFQLLLTLPWCPWETQLNLGSHTMLRQHSFPSAYPGNFCAFQGLVTQSIHRPIWQYLTLTKDISPYLTPHVPMLPLFLLSWKVLCLAVTPSPPTLKDQCREGNTWKP